MSNNVPQSKLLHLAHLLYRDDSLACPLFFERHPVGHIIDDIFAIDSYQWVLCGPYRLPCFVEPGMESDCNDFGVLGILAIIDEVEAFDMVLV